MQLHSFFILLLGTALVRTSDPGQCNCAEKVNVCSVGGLPGIPGNHGLPGRDGMPGPKGEEGPRELELLKAQTDNLREQLEALHSSAALSQKVILDHVFPNNIRVGQKLFVTKGAEGNYETSKAACFHFGGQTASPRNSAENNALSKIAAKLGKHIFLGMNDRETEGVFQHLNGEQMQYSNWAVGEPNGVDEDCIEMYPDGQWNDKSCSENRLIVCELPSV